MNIDESNIFKDVKFLNNAKETIVSKLDLMNQWKKVADKFVKHKWIYRYIDNKQKEQLEKHYKVLTDENTNYSTYKKSFSFICKFIGIPKDQVIIENMVFTKDKIDKEQWEIAIKYSKGLAKVKIPDNIKLIHISPVKGIEKLIPSFRSKTKGKYMYPSKRVFFTIAKDIKPTKAGLENTERHRYTPKDSVNYAYIDPTYSDYASGAVYVDTENPIPVETFEKKMFNIFKNRKEDAK